MMSSLVLGMITNLIVYTSVSLAWPDPDRDCDLRVSVIGDLDRLGLGYEFYITPVVGVGDADLHHHRGGGHAIGLSIGRAWPRSKRYLLIDLFDRLVKKNTSTLKPNFDSF